MNTKFFWVIGIALWALPVAAQKAPTPPEAPKEAPAEAPKETPKDAPKEGKTNPDGSKNFDLGAFRVQGQVRKPEAFYILQRSSLSFQEVEKKQSFLGEVVNSVDKGKKF